MITHSQLANYLHDLLGCSSYKDYAPNGMQVEGKKNITRICTAVTAAADVIDEAVAQHADALLVHHGFFWRGEDPVVTGMKKHRISKLLNHDINLFAYHLPLDCHLSLGNNACLARLFSVSDVKSHQVGGYENLLWTGTLEQPMSGEDLQLFLKTQLIREPLHVNGTKALIQNVAWCSGGAQDYIEDAWKLGVDAYISGEISERTYYQAKELDIHYYAAGHHATERYGIQAVGHLLAEKFGLIHQYIDTHNPV